MSWGHVIIIIWVALVLALTRYVYRKKGWVGKGLAAGVVVIGVAGWALINVQVVQNQVFFAPDPVTQIDKAMNEAPTFKVIKEQEPQLWTNIREQALKLMKEGKSQQQVIDAIQPQILQLQMKRLQSASDAEVIAYMRVNMEQTALIQKSSDDNCFRFLFPGVKGGINATHILSAELLTHRMNVDASMMRSAYGIEKHTVTQQERQQAQTDIQPIVQQLVKQYGEDIQLADDPYKGVGKEGVACNLVQDLWRNVLLLPQPKAAAIIRLSLEMN